MVAPTRIQIAKPDIIRHFDELKQRVLKEADIAQILAQERGFWRLAQRTTTGEFIDFLARSGRLKVHEFSFPSRSFQAYTWVEVPAMEIALALRPRSFLSHFTAAKLHGLTEQVPRTLYVTHEQSQHHARAQDGLTQQAIDSAFQKPERYTTEIADHQGFRICLINGLPTEMAGVMEMTATSETGASANVKLTNIERTLIDITVRPGYAGGVTEVLKAFREAKDQVSSNRLRAQLQKQNYVYPFHQAIGFYLQRTGYGDRAVDLFKQLPRPHKFYLAHAMPETDFVPEWNLYVPKGL